MAIEIVSFPIKNGEFFHSYVTVYQRVFLWAMAFIAMYIYIYIAMYSYVKLPEGSGMVLHNSPGCVVDLETAGCCWELWAFFLQHRGGRVDFLTEDGVFVVEIHTHVLHVWNIYLHLPQKSTKCR